MAATNYISIIRDLQRFRGSALSYDDYYDFPNHQYFKILFHFNNFSDALTAAPGTLNAEVTDASQARGTGLLDPTWLRLEKPDKDWGYNEDQRAENNKSWGGKAMNYLDDQKKSKIRNQIRNLWDCNSAWSYLVINDEIDRANNLQAFVEMLSNINSRSPWYFQNIKGLEGATRRDMVTGPFSMKTDDQKITIECLPDAYDQRISTLLDLYRSVVWSWETKREVLPANLRKFDMTIIAFQPPLRNYHVPGTGLPVMNNASVRSKPRIGETAEGFAYIYDTDLGEEQQLASYKAWEFHGCEFDYNSGRAGWDTIDNAAGTSIQANIDITFTDCFEIRFNEFLGRHIGDIMGDNAPYKTGGNTERTRIDGAREVKSLSKDQIAVYEPAASGWLAQGVSKAMGAVTSKVKSKYLGNIYGLSLSNIGRQLGNLSNASTAWGTLKNTIKGK